jgi:hypothetical protein
MKIYQDVDSGKRLMNRRTARTLVMTYEHEAMHVEVATSIIGYVMRRV